MIRWTQCAGERVALEALYRLASRRRGGVARPETPGYSRGGRVSITRHTISGHVRVMASLGCDTCQGRRSSPPGHPDRPLVRSIPACAQRGGPTTDPALARIKHSSAQPRLRGPREKYVENLVRSHKGVAVWSHATSLTTRVTWPSEVIPAADSILRHLDAPSTAPVPNAHTFTSSLPSRSRVRHPMSTATSRECRGRAGGVSPGRAEVAAGFILTSSRHGDDRILSHPPV